MMNDWIKKIGILNTAEYYSSRKQNFEILLLATMGLEGIILSLIKSEGQT